MKKVISLFVLFIILGSLFGLSPTLHAQESTVLLQDDFNDGNFNGWTVEGGNWFVDTNKQLAGFGFGKALSGRISNGGQWDNYILELDVKSDSGIDEGIGFRRLDGSNNYELQLRHGTGAFNTPEIVLNKVQNGVFKNLFDSHATPLGKSITYHLKIEANGENIKFSLDGNQIFDIIDKDTQVKKGPISLSYSTGDYGSSIVRFDNVKVTAISTPIPTPSPSSTPTPEPKKIPLIFIPGIGGSELKVAEDTDWSAPDGHGGVYTHHYAKDEKVWVNQDAAIIDNNDDYFDVLRLTSDGNTSTAGIKLSNTAVDEYNSTVDYFKSIGYTLNQDLFIFTYDWRKNLSLSSSPLDELISSVKLQTNEQKVDVVSHSMGGLVIKNYILDPQKAMNIRKLITLGTPYLGSVDTLKNLRYGSCFTTDILKSSPLCIGISALEVKDLTNNYPSIYTLIPTQKYYSFYNNSGKLNPNPIQDERDLDNNEVTGNLNYDQTKQLLKNLGHNTALFSPAESFHNLDNNLSETNGVDSISIVGSGMGTLGQIVEKYKFNFGGIKIPTTDMVKINGDDTVPLFSASLNDPDQNISFFDPTKVFYVRENHASLSSNKSVLKFIDNILNSDSTKPEGISTTPFKFKGIQFSAHSPVNIHVFDITGNHTGPTLDGGFETNIPGSSYEMLDDAKFIFVPDDGIYKVKFEATDQGNFDFKVRHYSDDLNDKTILYKNIPLSKQTQAESAVNTDDLASTNIAIDEDGDGITDINVQPTSILNEITSYDQTAPSTDLEKSGIKGLNDWYRSDVQVSLISEDAINGSGVNKIEYSLDNGKTSQVYSNPFTISSEGVTKIQFKSIDNAGNEEPPKESVIKIDKTAPEAIVTFNIDLKNFNIDGTDSLGQVIVENNDDKLAILTDQSGNKTAIRHEQALNNGHYAFEISEISYNDKQPDTLVDNTFKVEFEKDSKISLFKQFFKLKGEEKIKAQYYLEKNLTKIEYKQTNSNKITSDLQGIVFLKLLTDKSQLKVTY